MCNNYLTRKVFYSHLLSRCVDTSYAHPSLGPVTYISHNFLPSSGTFRFYAFSWKDDVSDPLCLHCKVRVCNNYKENCSQVSKINYSFSRRSHVVTWTETYFHYITKEQYRTSLTNRNTIQSVKRFLRFKPVASLLHTSLLHVLHCIYVVIRKTLHTSFISQANTS